MWKDVPLTFILQTMFVKVCKRFGKYPEDLYPEETFSLPVAKSFAVCRYGLHGIRNSPVPLREGFCGSLLSRSWGIEKKTGSNLIERHTSENDGFTIRLQVLALKLQSSAELHLSKTIGLNGFRMV